MQLNIPVLSIRNNHEITITKLDSEQRGGSARCIFKKFDKHEDFTPENSAYQKNQDLLSEETDDISASTCSGLTMTITRRLSTESL